jgi:hypothetical protein
LTGKRNERNGIHVGVGQAGHDIGHARTGRHQNDAGLTGGLGVAFSHVGGALFVAGEHQVDVLALAKHIENLEHYTAGQSKNRIHALLPQ